MTADDVSLSPAPRYRPSLSMQGKLKPYFGSPGNSIITLGCVLVIAWAFRHVIDWLLLDAVFTGTPATCQKESGACWPFLVAKLRFMLFGFIHSKSSGGRSFVSFCFLARAPLP